jgi:beta-glucosidase-like glycosyl hydrolase
VLTSHLGVAYSSGLSKNGSWSDPDAVVPVMKVSIFYISICTVFLTLFLQHFAAHGSPEGGRNTAPFMGRGIREVLMESLTAFKAAFDLGGVKGVMM